MFKVQVVSVIVQGTDCFCFCTKYNLLSFGVQGTTAAHGVGASTWYTQPIRHNGFYGFLSDREVD